MVHFHTQHSPSRAYRNRCYLESLDAAEQVLEQYGNRRREYNPMRSGIEMTKCLCERMEDPLVMSRNLFTDVIRHNKTLEREQTLDLVIDLLNKQKQLWFSQSLTAGSATFWNNKVQTTEQLLHEIEKLK